MEGNKYDQKLRKMSRQPLRYVAIFLLLLINLEDAFANPRYFILFNDKANSPFSINKPTGFLSERAISRRARQKIQITENDLPVNPSYLSALRQTGALVIFESRWFNGAVVEATADQLDAIKKLSFYKGIELNLPIANLTTRSPGVARIGSLNEKFATNDVPDYGRMRDQLALLGIEQLHQRGLRGENMIIAVFDNGFIGANERDFFKPIFEEKRLLDSYNFLTRQSNVFTTGTHGHNVLSFIAAYKPGTVVGAAFKATFALYTTESDQFESPYEEVTWLMAAERADSLGVDVINSSLGYYDFAGEFNTPAYNYPYKSMDGKTTIISKAARFATRKGILVVNAAGNEGNNKDWKYIMAPADVDSVLSVGATDYMRNYAPLSSIGPNAIGQQKPDIAAVGLGAIYGNASGGASSGSGTSYASPQIAGLAAVLWQAYPTLTAQQIITALKKSGHQAAKPDNFLGYGVPDVKRAEASILNEIPVLGVEPGGLRFIVLSPNPAQERLTLDFPAYLVGRKVNISIVQPNGTTISNAATTIQNKLTVDITNLKSGIYILHINTKDQSRSFKFLRTQG
jgi:serine protease AprX